MTDKEFADYIWNRWSKMGHNRPNAILTGENDGQVSDFDIQERSEDNKTNDENV